MSNVFDTARLISAVKRIANIPDNQSMISDAQILHFCNEEFTTSFLPLVLSEKETYYTIREDIEITDSTENRYPVPYRAIGSKLEWVGFYDTNSNNEEIPTELNMVTFDQLSQRSGNYDSGNSSRRFYFENESVVIDSRNASLDFDFLVFRYNIQPNTLVASDRVSVITGIDANSGLITVDNVPDNFATSSKIDFIRTQAPNNILNYDVAIVDVNASSLLFQVDPLDIPEQLAVGDRICLAQETDLIYAPTELHPILAQMVAVRVLESNGDDTKTAEKTLRKMEDKSQFLMTSRDSSSPVKVSVRRNGLLGRRRR
jgi:hypothetical protein